MILLYSVVFVLFALLLVFLVFYLRYKKFVDSPPESNPALGKIKFDKPFDGEYDVIVVGAGIVGCAVAKGLGDQGRKVLLVERDLNTPDRIVGELLQPIGVKLLKDLGLVDCLEGIDAAVATGYKIYFEKEWIDAPYNTNPETGKTFTGKSFHHGAFIDKLREAARKTPNVEIVQGTVQRLLEDDDTVSGVVYLNGEKKETSVRSKLTVCCDGCFSKFRKDLSSSAPAIASHFCGIIVKGDLPFEGRGHVIVGERTPILCYRISSTEYRVLVDIAGNMPNQAELRKRFLTETVLEFPEQMRADWIKALNETTVVKSMPNQKLVTRPLLRKGVVMLGDALNMRHPLTGAGMSCAFNDAVSLKNNLANVDMTNSKDVTYAVNRVYYEHSRFAATINVLSFALYGNVSRGKRIKAATAAYIARGGDCVDGPMGLLSGVVREPHVFAKHYTNVAIISLLSSLPFKIFALIGCGTDALANVVPLWWNEMHHDIRFSTHKQTEKDKDE